MKILGFEKSSQTESQITQNVREIINKAKAIIGDVPSLFLGAKLPLRVLYFF